MEVKPSRTRMPLNRDVLSEQASQGHGQGAKEKVGLGEFEKHTGWHQTIKKERFKMIE